MQKFAVIVILCFLITIVQAENANEFHGNNEEADYMIGYTDGRAKGSKVFELHWAIVSGVAGCTGNVFGCILEEGSDVLIERDWVWSYIIGCTSSGGVVLLAYMVNEKPLHVPIGRDPEYTRSYVEGYKIATRLSRTKMALLGSACAICGPSVLKSIVDGVIGCIFITAPR